MCSKKRAAFYVAEITLRLLTPEDWEMFRSLRLRAIRMHTGYFLAKPEDAEKEPPEHWRQTLNGQGKAVFGLFDGTALIGITAVFTWREDPSGQSGVMAMSFIEPAYRGKGYSGLFYKARIEFAKNHRPWKILAIAHREGNEPSKRAMLKHGFIFTGTKEIDWPDGTCGPEYCYEMDLEKLRAGNP
jgi:RimJ/RimL family protein N-acetyltransferase